MPVRSVTPELISEYTRAGAWQDRNLAEVVLDLPVDRDKIALIDKHESISYRQLMDRAAALAGWMAAHGGEPGDVLCLQASSRAVLVVAHMACVLADMVYVPISDHLTPAERTHLVVTSRARFLVLPDTVADVTEIVRELRAASPSLAFVGSLHENAAGTDFDLAAACAGQGAPGPGRRGDPNRPHLAMISSGTTQLPKISLWSDNNLWYFLEQFRLHIALTADDIALQIAPANTGSTGYVFPVLTPVLNGATAVLTETWSAAAALDLIESARPTIASGVPTQIIKMMSELEISPRDCSSLRAFNNAGAALGAENARKIERAFGCLVQTSYGASDGGVPTLTSVEDDEPHRLGSVGRVLPHSECRLVDEQMNDVPAGEAGEVIWRNPTKTFGYLNNPEQDAQMFWGDGWYRSGDLGIFDADGYLHIVGRRRDMIIRGGLNVSPREIEDLVRKHPAVSDIAVVGYADPVYGERIAACVVLNPGRDLVLGELDAFLRAEGLSSHKVPDRLELFDDFPRNTGGKVSKLELRDELTARSQQPASS
jgi:acyl-CoA synthetase (AMP-forming)/AMP-acid ligase II